MNFDHAIFALLIAAAFVIPYYFHKIQQALHANTVAMGKAYGNVNDLSDKVDKTMDRLSVLSDMLVTIDGRIDENAIMVRDKVIERLDERLDQVALQASLNKDGLHHSLLEMTTAITKAFMEETIEIKQGIEVLVEALAEPVGVHSPIPPSTPCQVKECIAEGTIEVPYAGQKITVCEQHAQMLAKSAMSKPAKRREKVLCEDGYDHRDDPDYIPGQIHAHVEIPDKEEFLAAEGISGEPDATAMKPEPLDPISAAIEAAYQAKKGEINAALDQR